MKYYILAVPDETVELLCEDKDPRIEETVHLSEMFNDEIVEPLIGKETELHVQLYECFDDPQTVKSTYNQFNGYTAISSINGDPIVLTVFTTREKVNI